MTRPGARGVRTAEALAAQRSPVEQRLAAGTMPECSWRYQIAGVDGDAGRALSAWDTDGGLSRAPETPVLETYQGERFMVRLIQGAQEVQHNFNLAGLAFPRNVDQRYPQGMRDLAVTVPPARAACFDAVRHTHPESYENWLDGKPPAAGEAPYWDAFSRALARCDNLEGYTYSQEVGISEHFEMRGRLRADISVMEFLPPNLTPAPAPAPAGEADGPRTGHREASDYLYNFGTLNFALERRLGLRPHLRRTRRVRPLAAGKRRDRPAAREPRRDGDRGPAGRARRPGRRLRRLPAAARRSRLALRPRGRRRRPHRRRLAGRRHPLRRRPPRSRRPDARAAGARQVGAARDVRARHVRSRRLGNAPAQRPCWRRSGTPTSTSPSPSSCG